MINKIIVRYADGSIKKGTTENFFPNKYMFYLRNLSNGEQEEIFIKNLKAVFFVKEFDGNPQYKERNDIERSGFGKKVSVRFKDGETIVGFTQGFSHERAGFFLFPIDLDSNNEKCFIVISATDKVAFM